MVIRETRVGRLSAAEPYFPDMPALLAMAKANRQQMRVLFMADRNVYAAEDKN